MSQPAVIQKVSNANIYINGNTLLGVAAEIDLPKLTAKMIEHKALGMIGAIELPAGIEKMEARIMWNSFYADAMGAMANFYQAQRFQIRASQEVFTSQGLVEEQPVVIFMTAMSKDLPTGNFKQHENVELESNLAVNYLRMEINGRIIVELDPMANIYKVLDEDIMVNYRRNIGQ